MVKPCLRVLPALLLMAMVCSAGVAAAAGTDEFSPSGDFGSGMDAASRRADAAEHPGRTWSALASSRWVGDGSADAKKILYLFSDPNCVYCYRFWKASRPWVKSGKVQVRYILVGILGSDSIAKAATILASSSPVVALAAHERSYPKGGITPSQRVSAAARRQLERNRALLRELGFQGVPGIVARDDQQQVQLWPGLPADADLPELLGPRDD